MCFFEVAVLKITYYISKNILVTKLSKKKNYMGDSSHKTHHTSKGMTHCPQKCVSKYLRKAKKLCVSLYGF
jgi:hypothetical protein